MEPFTLDHALAKYPVGQQRTSKHKPWVFLAGDYAWKGPYLKDGRLTNVMTRSAIFAAWNTPCVVRAVDSVETPDGIFVRFPNLMANYSLETVPFTESFSGHTYNVIVNPPVTDIRAALPSHTWITAEAEDLLVALCHCFILGVGDMNLRNAMVDTVSHKLYLIDFDDNLATDKVTEAFYFNKLPAKNLNWYQSVRGHYQHVAQRLEPLLTDATVLHNNYHGRVQQTIHLLQQYGQTIRLTLNVVRNVGRMVWKGLRGGSLTYSGLKVDAVKSAVQKYVRRQIPFKALIAAHELYQFSEVGGDAVVTNLYNRVAIIAAEDIGPGNLPLVLEVIRVVESKDRDVYRLCAMVQLLADSPKTRIMSHAHYAYGTVEGQTAAIAHGIGVSGQFTESDKSYLEQNVDDALFEPSDPELIRPYLRLFLKRLREKDLNAFVFAAAYTANTQDLTLVKRKKFIQGNPRSTTGDPSILLWKALAQVLPPQTHDILVDAYYKHTESRPFLQLAIIVAVYQVPYQAYDLEPTVEMIKREAVYQRILQNEFPLELDPYVLDKHTAEGRQAGKGTAEFVTNGAMVIPQDQRYYEPQLEALYQSRK